MFVLWLIALYATADAYGYRQMTYSEMKSFLDSLNADGFFSQYPEHEATNTAYADYSSTQTHPHELFTTESTSTDYSVSQTISPYEDGETKEYTEEESEYLTKVGSIPGIPGIDFPDYTNIPLTSFRCSDKQHIPGFYADTETGCQVFHVCWPHRRETFLCPVGTIFNQAILVCDYWYSSNCSLATHYYNGKTVPPSISSKHKQEANMGSMISTLLEPTVQSEDTSAEYHDADLSYILKFLPVKAKVVVYPEAAKKVPKVIAEASIGKSKKQKEHGQPRPVHMIHKVESDFPVHRKTTFRSQKGTITPVISPKIKSKYSHERINPSVNKIIDQVFDIAKKIVEEAKELAPAFDSGKTVDDFKPRNPVHSRKNYTLTKLNQKFAIKPVEMPKAEIK